MNNQSLDSFQLQLFKEINNYKLQSNILFSPLSIYIALSLCANGAEHTTFSELIQTLAANKTIDQINNECNQILSLISTSVSIKIANAVMSTIDKSKEFTVKCEQYKAFVDQLKTVQQVNDWCAKHTNNKITSIIDQIDQYTRLLILNAVYFLGKWKISFNKDFTNPWNFINSKQENFECKMMKQIIQAPYNRFDNCQVIQLNYSEKKIFAIVILPSIAMNDFINGLTDEKLEKYTSNLFNQRVIFGLPQFMIESSEILNDYLMNLGIKQAFDKNKGEFQPMFKTKGIYFIDNILQKSFIKVDEEGTEAASVTKIEVKASCSGFSNGPIYMYCNSPFLFIIKHRDIRDHYFFITKVEKPI